MPQSVLIVLQVIIALGLLNVWCLRANRATGFRGGNAKNIKEEFAVYGLSENFCYLVGFLKISCAILLLLGLWFEQLRLPAALIVSVLMLGAVAMHAKVRDPIKKTVPAALMLIMSVVVSVSFFGG
jgi:uncharacterized membrane protein YphA (DoxX/SURF4 family)